MFPKLYKLFLKKVLIFVWEYVLIAIRNILLGASQADATILVVDATKGEFETGFDSGGQTREHALLIRSLGKYAWLVGSI